LTASFRAGPGTDTAIRAAAFEWLAEQVAVHGEVLPWNVLLRGFDYQGQRVPLLSQQGIFKPRVLESVPLSIRTSPGGPYDDGFVSGGRLRYRYRGTDPGHAENVGLRRAMELRAPLVYFHGITKGQYLAAWPVFVIADDPGNLTFSIAVDDVAYSGLDSAQELAEPRREYITTTFRRRVHQQAFRYRVLRAYQSRCALCRLRHDELLDAAHIVPDSEERGEPVVSNGLALCKLHHAAFDRSFLAVRPDYMVEVRRDVLEESDGPMLLHGLQGLHERRIVLPRKASQRPNPELLAWRYERFKAAS
jgi:putative restriction endonuclease